jgi:sec-independent protein translocase protein TatB
MFDIGFSEIVVIGVVALLVFGPEDLPKVARIAGRMLGNFRRYVDQVKSELDQEIQASELKQLGQDIKDSAQTLQTSFSEQMHAVEAEWQASSTEVASVAQEITAPAQALADVAHEAVSPAIAVEEAVAVSVVPEPATVAKEVSASAVALAAVAVPAIVEEPAALPLASSDAAEPALPLWAEPVAEVTPVLAAVAVETAVAPEAEPASVPEKDIDQLDLFGMPEPSAISPKG